MIVTVFQTHKFNRVHGHARGYTDMNKSSLHILKVCIISLTNLMEVKYLRMS